MKTDDTNNFNIQELNIRIQTFFSFHAYCLISCWCVEQHDSHHLNNNNKNLFDTGSHQIIFQERKKKKHRNDVRWLFESASMFALIQRNCFNVIRISICNYCIYFVVEGIFWLFESLADFNIMLYST